MTDPATGPAIGRPRQIIAAARALLEDEGPEALTMRRLADRVGIKAPSLYKHFPDKSCVVTALAEEMLRESGEALEAAERAAPGSFPALATAYRAYALAHPHLYLLTTGRPLDRAALTPGVEAAAAAPILRVVGGDEHRARAAWAFAHGMVVLELNGRFPPGADLTAAWDTGAEAFT
ncbi:TetR/AcrR family transcriptional regulator [Streptomyces sp. NBC_00654]|uniref:TetR/AcrR family transcriptional regulator n=1 Tax=Streptomyces sp. NBC_00654 TaxID=2975799 RepID=UPI0022510065|nr:TetR/AcrR family transcriptional regulator [Streptomyces sp. NBC_00654]MCX4969001.1 TetR/AcrR family transcriptional regulator [Streptomyces sp. NBC_00654]